MSAVYMRKYASRKETTNILHEARIQSKERSSNRGVLSNGPHSRQTRKMLNDCLVQTGTVYGR